MQKPPIIVNLAEADELLSLVNTQARYQQFKRWFEAIRHRDTRTGPFYSGLPSRVNPVDVYDPDKVVLASSAEFRNSYVRLLHLSLSGQYRLAETVPRLGSGRLLDLHTLNSVLAPFRPLITRSASDTAARQWDRNAAAQLGKDFAPIAASPEQLYFSRYSDEFERLTALSRNYLGNASNNAATQCGYRIDPNIERLLQMIRAFLQSAEQYNAKLNDTAQVYQTGVILEQKREQLARRLAALQREKYEDLAKARKRSDLTPEQRRLIDAFNVSFKRTVQSINAQTALRRRRQ